MAFDDLTQFLQSAADSHSLMRVEESLHPHLEIAATTELICSELQQNSPILLFENPNGSSVSVVTNLLGNRERFLSALGTDQFSDVIQRLRSVFNPSSAQRTWGLSMSASAADRDRFAPRSVRRGLCQQVVKLGKDIDLEQFPVLQCWPGESGRAITSGLVIITGIEGETSVEQIPLEIRDHQTLQIHWKKSDRGARLLQQWLSQNRQCPIAIALGGDPLLTYTASLPVPEGISPWLLTGIFRNEGINLIKGRSIEALVPADAEIIIEGFIDPAAKRGTGTLTNACGLLETRHNLPAMQISAITHRAHPIFPACVNAYRFQEQSLCSELTELMLLHIIRLTQPAVEKIHFPRSGASQQALFVGVDPEYSEAVPQIVHTLCSLPGTSQAKLIVLVDAEVDLHNSDQVWRDVCVQLQTAAELQYVHSTNHSPLVINGMTQQRPGAGFDLPARLQTTATPQTLERIHQILGHSSASEQAPRQVRTEPVLPTDDETPTFSFKDSR